MCLAAGKSWYTRERDGASTEGGFWFLLSGGWGKNGVWEKGFNGQDKVGPGILSWGPPNGRKGVPQSSPTS